MTISATTQGLKPGVCTSTNRPANPFDGMVIYETDTDRAMVYNGTAWVVLSTGRANSLGLDLVKTQTIGSAVSSVTVSDAFSSTYDNYKIMVVAGSSSASVDMWMTLGATATGYYYGLNYNLFNSTASATGASNAAKWAYAGSSTGTSIAINADILSPFLTEQTFFTSTVTSDGYVGSGGGYLANTTSYTAFTLTPSSGTLTGGTISVYGYAK
jgi:hypothetical protein